MLWLVGQYAATAPGEATTVPGIHNWAPDVLRNVARSFMIEVSIDWISLQCFRN